MPQGVLLFEGHRTLKSKKEAVSSEGKVKGDFLLNRANTCGTLGQGLQGLLYFKPCGSETARLGTSKSGN